MDKKQYQDAAALRKRCVAQASTLQEQLKSFAKDVNDFYEIMRWQGVDCSEETYEALFKNFEIVK